MDHFIEYRDGAWGLRQLHVVVAARHHRWAAVEAHEAPLGQTTIFRVVGTRSGASDTDRRLELMSRLALVLQQSALAGDRFAGRR